MRSSILTTVAVCVALATPSPLARRETYWEVTDRLLFNTTIEAFEATRAVSQYALTVLDWTSDGCSDALDAPMMFNFLPSCHRHDFGYRNYKKQSRFNAANKLRIDHNFARDLSNECNRQRAKNTCRLIAGIYYDAVRMMPPSNLVRNGEEFKKAIESLKTLEERHGGPVKAKAPNPSV